MSEKKTPLYNLISLGLRLESYRNSKGLKKTEAGRLVGVSSQAIDNWEKGKVEPSLLSYLMKLAADYDCDLNWLILGQEPQGGAPADPDDWKGKYLAEVEAHRTTLLKLDQARERLETSMTTPIVSDMETAASILALEENIEKDK
jgi:DNA-binding XRE family transcriptional regulator